MLQLLLLLLGASVHLGYSYGLLNDERQLVCSGRDFHMYVDSRSRIVTFTPNSPPGPKRVLLERNNLKDPRYEWRRDMTLVVPEVTHRDQGRYAIEMLTGFTYEIIHLAVSECVKKFTRRYGETFKLEIPNDGAVLEFSPQTSSSLSPAPTLSPSLPPSLSPSLSPSAPVVLWNRTDGGVSEGVRGRVRGGHWVAERVRPADQGNYTIRDSNGKVVSRANLTVTVHLFKLTLFRKESLSLLLFMPPSEARVFFYPPARTTLRHSSILLRDGQIVEEEPRYRARLALERNSTGTYMVVGPLSEKDDGTYEVWDGEGTLVSRTWLKVDDKHIRWRAVIKSIIVPSGMFAALAGLFLFLKRYPSCSIHKILSGLQDRHNAPTANLPSIHIQDYSQPRTTSYSGSPRGSSSPAKWQASPTHTGYTLVIDGGHRHSSENTPVDSGHRHSPQPVRAPDRDAGVRRGSASNYSVINEQAGGERKGSFSVAGATDCLHSSASCLQYQVRTERGKEGKDHFSALPLDTDTSNTCSVYTSDKLNFL